MSEVKPVTTFMYDFIKIYEDDGDRSWFNVYDRGDMFAVRPGYDIELNRPDSKKNITWYNVIDSESNERVGQFCTTVDCDETYIIYVY